MHARRLDRAVFIQVVQQRGRFNIQADVPAPVGVFNFGFRLDADLHAQKVRYPKLQHTRHGFQAGTRAGHGQHQPVAQVIADFMRQVQQKVVTVATLPVALCIAVVEDFQVDVAHGRVVLRQEAAHIAQTTGFVEQVKHGLVTTQDLAVLGGYALRPKQQFSRAGVQGVGGRIQHIAHTGLHHQVYEQRRHVNLARAHHGEVIRLQRSGG